MKLKFKLKYILIATLGFRADALFGHEVPVHQTITYHAAASAQSASPAYTNFLNTIRLECDLFAATNSMVEGSAREDDPVTLLPTDEGGYRSVNHFYDPLTGLGLSNIPPDDRPTSGTLGIDSFTWASKNNSPGKFGAYNIWSWQNARDNEWLGLTAAYPSDRHDDLVKMFRAVGQVVHLLEDTSQPQHVRNEQHLVPIWVSPIEKYGKENLPYLNFQPGMLPWKADGFTKLEDFWNRHLYAPGNATVLANAEAGGAQLGLAEWCNGNFIGARHTFPEYSTPGKVANYPFPSRDSSTDYNDVKANPAAHITNLGTIEGIPVTGNGIYLKKTGDGVTYDHIARVNYLGAKLPNANLKGTPYCTIKDDNVLHDYHYKLIPKAVEYSAGLLDYFFRGRLEVSDGYVFNISGESLAFSGGAFYFYKENSAGIRTLVHTIPLTTVLNSGDGIPITIPETSTSWVSADQVVVVYKGNIGVGGGGTPNDPVDTDIAIAVVRYPVFPNEAGEYLQFLDCFNDFAFHEIPAGMFYSAISTEWANYWSDEWAAAQYPDECSQ
jgi:hypothetical protein